MSIPEMLTPIAMLVEVLVVVLGFYLGYKCKKRSGYLLAIAFLLFALYDYLESAGLSEDAMAVINLVAATSALGAVFLMVKGEPTR
jgi:uncharacterized membrane protein